ncbi:ferredoxin [Spiroplasma endosymbiont of Megaselia nigra]|uniref:ferredoxin n=1 Tax=Spiroplasma endosymbiont of Megaselia nigra TaxID=2478537 RepID=UPI000F8738A0|nr:ferredoxin [Spiroplasma endosymbiont of Megaselia nigra]RUO86672.1 ferredoxin [Spiroplasma endosymbiont of Megaselia nigra]
MANRNISKKRTYVNTDLCISCGSCIMIDETETFFMDDDGFANTIDNDKELVEAQMVCPTAAIFIKTLEEFKENRKSSLDNY